MSCFEGKTGRKPLITCKIVCYTYVTTYLYPRIPAYAYLRVHICISIYACIRRAATYIYIYIYLFICSFIYLRSIRKSNVPEAFRSPPAPQKRLRGHFQTEYMSRGSVPFRLKACASLRRGANFEKNNFKI